MQILDTHFHLLSMKEKNLPTEISESLIGTDIGCSPEDIDERLVLLQGRQGIRTSQGAGPWCLDDGMADIDSLMSRLEENLERIDSTFIGECGLDFYWKYGTPAEQEELFIRQIELSNKLMRPIIIHSRDADSAMLDIIGRSNFQASGIMHCYSSGPQCLERILDKGLYVSFAGNVTYKANVGIQEAARFVPDDRILYETDAPYLAPVPMRGKPNRPEYTAYTSAFIAQLRGEEVEEFRGKAIENYKRLVSISTGHR